MPAKRLFQLWRVVFILICLSGFLCLVWLLSTPSETSSAFLLGYSFPRILLAVGIILPSLFFTFLVAARSKAANELLTNRLDKSAKRSSVWIYIAVDFVALISLWTLFFLPERRALQIFGPYSLYLSVAKPFVLYGIFLAAGALLLLLNARFHFGFEEIKKDRSNLRFTLLIFLSLVGIAGVISISRIGLGFDSTIWNAPGTPILITQVLLVISIAALLLATLSWLRRRLKNLDTKLHVDLILASLVWILAAVFWLAQSAPSTYYDTSPQPPNFQSYPLSDAFNHDVIANNVLIGEGFRFGGQVAVRRPVYVLFLTGLESMFGGNYDDVIASQVIVLALFPAILFLLGTKMHSRLAGLLLAGFVIFREANSIVLGDVINTSHAKLLMADLPTALMVSGFALAAFAWLSRQPDNKLPPLLVGGFLGWAILLRSQSLTLLPFILLLFLLIWGLKKAWKPALLFLVGMVLVASPWIIRNKVLMGQWAIEDAVVAGFLANRYSFTPGTFGLPFLSGETEGEYYARQMARVRDFAFQNPSYVAGFVADNFVRNQLLNIFATPLSLQLRDLESHVRDLPYWPGWEGQLDPETYLPLTGSLLIMSVGISAAWKRFGWLGLLPVFINVGFTLNLALARVSGWRYNLPVDWTVLFYYALGIAQCIFWIILLAKNRVIASQLIELSSEKKTLIPSHKKPKSQNHLMFAALLLLVAGSSFLIIEMLSLPRYMQVTPKDAITTINTIDSSGVLKQLVIDLINSGKTKLINGRALYPRYYGRKDGEAGRNFVLIEPMDFKRITFFLIGPNPTSAILRVDDSNIDFPSSSDVLVVRCSNSNEVAALVVMDQENGRNLYVSSDLSKSCP